MKKFNFKSYMKLFIIEKLKIIYINYFHKNHIKKIF